MVTALILAGGKGTRLGSDIPKQYVEVGGKPIISYCMNTLACNNKIDAVWIVADKAWREFINSFVNEDVSSVGKLIIRKFCGFSEPGENRQLSIYNGVRDIMDNIGGGYVLIHDAARPRISMSLINRCFAAVKEHDGAIPVIPMKDTIYQSIDGKNITGLLDRKTLFAGQSPEIFDAGKYCEANRALLYDRILNINGSTEPAVLYGMNIAMVNGDETNYKITTAADLERFKMYIASLSI